MMNAIYKRYRGRELDALLVMADAVAAGSVDQALKENIIHDVYVVKEHGMSVYSSSLLLLKDKSVHLPYDVQEKLHILRSSEGSVEKQCSHGELMDLNEVNDLITGIFLSVSLSNMVNTGKTSYLCVMPCFYLFMPTIVLLHFKI